MAKWAYELFLLPKPLIPIVRFVMKSHLLVDNIRAHQVLGLAYQKLIFGLETVPE